TVVTCYHCVVRTSRRAYRRDLLYNPSRRTSDLPNAPAITFIDAGDPSTTLLPDAASTWISSTVYKAVFQVNDAGVEIGDIAVERSEELTSELQSRENIVCRLLL